MSYRPIALIGLAAGACVAPDLPGAYFDIEVSLADDRCNATPVAYDASFTYRVEIGQDQSFAVSIGADTFAEGEIEGCNATYVSLPFDQPRPEGDVRWQLTGSASVEEGNNSCGTARDWLGTETFTVLASEDTSIQPGCTYTVDVFGTFTGAVDAGE